jgi:predicted metal-dependent peptidase
MSEFAKTAGVLTKVRIQLLTRSVFLATILLSLKTRIGRDDVPTAGVNSTTLAVNPDFFDPLTFEQQIGLIAHEAWHLAFNHAGRRGDRDPYIWNAAGDFVINFLLVSTGFQIPEGGCYDPQYAGMSTEEVYELEILDCDWVIHNKFTIDSQTNLLDLEFTGGGGTSFLPVINYCQETKPEVLIYFTDLEAEHITEEPGFPTLWVCYDKHKPQGIGETIYYNRDDYYSSHR